jgi:16S rRNA G1207 methylase RsmC
VAKGKKKRAGLVDRDLYYALNVINNKLNTIITLLGKGTQIMAASLDALTAEVERNTSVVASAKALIEGLAAQIDQLVAAGTVDPAQVDALAAALRANSDQLAEAVAAHTPAATA